MEPLAFVILCYNSFRDATRLCREILDLDPIGCGQVILVDNCSLARDGYTEWAGISHPQVRHIESLSNLGYGAGNNLGIDLALSLGIDRVVVLNPDVHLPADPDFIARIHATFEQRSFLIVGFGVEGILPYYSDGLLPILLPPLARFQDRIQHRQNIGKQELLDIGRVYGCAFAIRARRFRELGLFDERVFLYSEEHIVSALARKHQEGICHAPGIMVRHRVLGSSGGTFSSRHIKWICTSLEFYLRTYLNLPIFLAKGIALFHITQIYLAYQLHRIIARN